MKLKKTEKRALQKFSVNEDKKGEQFGKKS